jgi:hypothetical protein
MGPKTIPTIWGIYMKLVTKYQISAIYSCWEKCDEKWAYISSISDRERFLLNGPSSKFQWDIQKINGPYHKRNGPFFTCIFRFWKLCNRLSLYFSCQLSYTLYKTFYFHLSKARVKVFSKPVYSYGVRTFRFRFQ